MYPKSLHVHIFSFFLSSLEVPRKSARLTWENKSVYTDFVPTFRNFDFYLGRMLTYELKRCVKFDAASYWLLSPRVLRG